MRERRSEVGYWERGLAVGSCAEMAAKYAALLAVEGLPGGREQDAALREASRRWPGCLRESQLAGPERCGERGAQARAGAVGVERSRAEWREEGAAGMVLWADLHPLVGDLVAWRQEGRGEGGLAGFHRYVAEGGRAERWPADLALLERVAGGVVRARLAYGWLAWQAGLELAGLNWLLFGREGHWDGSRPGDPPRGPRRGE